MVVSVCSRTHVDLALAMQTIVHIRFSGGSLRRSIDIFSLGVVLI